MEISLRNLPKSTGESSAQRALRMRIRRICGLRSPSGKCRVDQSIIDEYQQGGQKRVFIRNGATRVHSKAAVWSERRTRKWRYPFNFIDTGS